jgi:hypothetical protein
MNRVKETTKGAHALVRLGWFHRYPARFATEVVTEMIVEAQQRLGRKPSLLLDPFAGTGATLAAARQLSIPSVGTELTTLGALIAQLRLDPPGETEEVLHRASTWIRRKHALTHAVHPELRTWLGDANAETLSTLKLIIAQERDPRVVRFLTIALSSALRPSSCWLPGSIKPQVDPHRLPSSLEGSFVRSMRALARDCEIERSDGAIPSLAFQADALAIPIADNKCECVITSPPYFTTYDYFDVHRLSYLAFGWSRSIDAQVGRRVAISLDGISFDPPNAFADWYRNDFKAESTIKGRALRLYSQRLSDHLL